MNVLKKILRIPARGAMMLIRMYQNTLSPIIGRQCRFTPTCSEYTHQAIDQFGLLRGSWRGLKRIAKCNPFHKGGYDPVE